MSQETFSNEYLICPYCGHREEADFETFFSNDIECNEEHDCEECGKTFIASRSVIYCYETFMFNDKKK